MSHLMRKDIVQVSELSLLLVWIASATNPSHHTTLPSITLDLFVASKCPDAARCENEFLPEVLAQVGDIVDVRLGFIGEHNSSATLGTNCMHGESECIGNAAQLCVQRHFPTSVNLESDSIDRLGPRHVWTKFLQCVGQFNHTAQSSIPGNTEDCLQKMSVPMSIIDKIKACTLGQEGKQLLSASVAHTLSACGHHTSIPRTGCKSCSMFLDGKPVCVLDNDEYYNCTGLGSNPESWIDLICTIAAQKNHNSHAGLPFRCRVGPAYQIKIWGHSYASTDPELSAQFAERYFGAERVRDINPGCGSSREIEVRYPQFNDFRGGGLHVRFVRNSRKPGGQYDIPAYVESMKHLYGNLSDNSKHHWNQFFDSHLGFYPADKVGMADALLQDGVPFFSDQSNGVFQSIYVNIPGTGKVIECLGDYLPSTPLPTTHIRLGSTQQFCTPKRRLGAQPISPNVLGVNYHHGDADLNKTTFAAADPAAGIDFAVRYLSASRLKQGRGPAADGECAKLSWAQWPDGHEWHLVDAKQADWVTFDHLRPLVPFNISDLAAYIENLRDLQSNQYDQWLDYRDIFNVSNLSAIAQILQEDDVPFGVWSRPHEGTCSLYVDLPGNGIAVELRSSEFSLPWLNQRCRESMYDLCSSGQGNRKVELMI
eukprot:TRINITY_DN91847_c0_g1_i1.p1 TRINITY_DN91847_c0_g1~~TRINITY_DN91847_c0_g1_i1.p1  ORF type:complete len:671 (-),score=57.20 TRINITY_DN91847_c0_g1_i1:19-1974(-)